MEEKKKEVKSQKDPLGTFNDWSFQLEFQKQKERDYSELNFYDTNA